MPGLPTSPTFSLSTMWYQGRFQRLGDFAAAARRLGYENIEISYVVPLEGVEELLESSAGIPSLHAPTPRIQVNGRWSEALNLASLDEDERRLGVELGKRTLTLAARAGARFVVFHLGSVGKGEPQPVRALRSLFQEGVREGEEVERLREAGHTARAKGAAVHLARAKQSLAELAEEAAALGVAIGIENRVGFHEIPNVDEGLELMADFPQGLVGYWHDVGHAEVLGRLGLIDKYRWLQELGDRCLGAHVHDVDGLTDHRAPGHGDADWGYVARYLPPTAPRTFEINQTIPEDQVAAAIGILKEKGVL